MGYNESIEISKPIILRGDKNTKIISCGKAPIITIKGEGITLKDLKIEQCNPNQRSVPAIFVFKNII